MNTLSKISGLLAAALATANSAHLAPAIRAVNALKALVDSPALDVLAGFTKSDWGEATLRKIRTGIDAVMQDFELPEVTVKPSKSVFYNQVSDLAHYLREQPALVQNSVYAITASVIAQTLSDGQLTQHEADTLVQVAYSVQKAKATA